MRELDAEIIVNGEAAVATSEQSGQIIASGGELDATCIVQTSRGKQMAVKTYSLGGGGAAKPEYVAQLPTVGEEGVLYMVNSGVTRDGYAIFQMFS